MVKRLFKAPERVYRCPHNGRQKFTYSGEQDGFGVMPNFHIWTCRGCGSTFSEQTLERETDKGQ